VLVADAWFCAICQDADEVWKHGKEEGGYLAMNDGVVVCLDVLRSVLAHLGNHENLQSLATSELIQKVEPFGRIVGEFFGTMPAKEISLIRKQRGNEGHAHVKRKVESAIRDQVPSFNPRGLDEWLRSRADADIPEAKAILSTVEDRIRRKVIALLMDNFGYEKSQWWPKVSQAVRVGTASRRERDNRSRGEEEQYLNLKDCRSIILGHWQSIFQPIFAYGDQGDKQARTEWLVRLNTLRTRLLDEATTELSMDEFSFLKTRTFAQVEQTARIVGFLSSALRYSRNRFALA
jgi:hypothetical protein